MFGFFIGSKSVSQGATGRNSGCDEDSTKHAIKRPKVVQAAQSTNDTESGGLEKPRNWAIYTFAWMNKIQLENWVRRKNHGAKLASIGTDQKCTVEFTPESIRRSSERMYRRAKKRLRRLCQSSRSLTEDVDAPDCLDFDFDDINTETKCGSFPSVHKEASSGCVSKEAPQDGVVKNDGTVERCTVHSTLVTHSASPCTVTSEVVQKHVDFNVDDDCEDSVHPKTDDLLCDKEVSVILEKGLITEVEETTSQVNDVEDDDANDGDSNCSTPNLEGNDSPVDANDGDSNCSTPDLEGNDSQDHCDVSLEDQATMCEEDGVTRSPEPEAESGSILEQDAAIKSPPAKMFDSNVGEEHRPPDIDMQDSSKDINEDDGVLHDAALEGNDATEDEQSNLFVTADINTVDEAKLIGGVALDLNSQHDKSTSETPLEVKEDSRNSEKASVMHTKGTITEDVVVNESTRCEAEALRGTSVITDDQENREDLTSVTGQSTPEVENVPFQIDGLDDETAKCPDKDKTREEKKQAEPEMASDEGGDKGAIIANSEPQTSEDNHMNIEPIATLTEGGKTCGTASEEKASTVTSTSPIVTSVTVSSDQLKEANNTLSTAYASTLNEPVMFGLPDQRMPLFTAVTTSMVPPLTAHFPAFPPPAPPPPPPPANFVWPLTTHTVPFTTAGIAPVLPPAQLQSSYGCNLSWANHTPHVPFQVGCVQPLAASGDLRPPGTDILPPGTDDVFSEPCSSVETFPTESVAQEEANKQTGDGQAHDSVLDHSVVTALMQFYSEINEVESSENTNVDGVEDKTETSFDSGILETVSVLETESAQTNSKEHEGTIDMEIESDQEFGVSKDVEVSENGGVAIPGIANSESSDKSDKIQDERVEMESADTSSQQSLSAAGVLHVHSKEDVTPVENSGVAVHVTEVKHSDVVMDEKTQENKEVFNTATPKESPDNVSGGTAVAISCVTVDGPKAGKPGIAMEESLLVNPAVTSNQVVTENPAITTDRTKADNDPSVNTDGTMEENLVQNPDIAEGRTLGEMQVEKGSVGVDGTVIRNVMENPDIAMSGALVENSDISSSERQVQRLGLAMDGKGIHHPSVVTDGTSGTSIDEPLSEKPGNVEEEMEEEQPLSPIDPLFMASAEQTIFSSIGGLRNLLGQSSTFDHIAEETIATTVSSLEDILRQAQSGYLESGSCPSDSGVSVGEDSSGPSRAFSNIPVSASPLQDDGYRTASLDGRSPWSCLSGGLQPEWPCGDVRTSERSETSCYISKGMCVSQDCCKLPLKWTCLVPAFVNKGATSRFVHFEVCHLQSVLIFSILDHPYSLLVYSCLFGVFPPWQTIIERFHSNFNDNCQRS